MSAVVNPISMPATHSSSFPSPPNTASWCGRVVHSMNASAKRVCQRISDCFQAIFRCLSTVFVPFNPEEKALLTAFQDPTKADSVQGDLHQLPALFHRFSKEEQEKFLHALSPQRALCFINATREGAERNALFTRFSLTEQSMILMLMNGGEGGGGDARTPFFQGLDPKIQESLFSALHMVNPFQTDLLFGLTDPDVLLRVLPLVSSDRREFAFLNLPEETQSQILSSPKGPVHQLVSLINSFPRQSASGGPTCYYVFNQLDPVVQARFAEGFTEEDLQRYVRQMDFVGMQNLIKIPSSHQLTGKVFDAIDDFNYRAEFISMLIYGNPRLTEPGPNDPARKYKCGEALNWMCKPVIIVNPGTADPIENPNTADSNHEQNPRLDYINEYDGLRDALNEHPNTNPVTGAQFNQPVRLFEGRRLQTGLFLYLLNLRGSFRYDQHS